MMNEKNIQSMPHEPWKPVEIERLPNDVICIEGVRYVGEIFRTLAFPSDDCLYTFRRDGEKVVLTTIRTLDEAKKFFQETGQEEPVHLEVDHAV